MKYDRNGALLESSIPGLPPPKRGKVRDLYDLGEHLLLVASDRISAFDCIMPNGIPDKGRVLNQLSLFWFGYFKDVPNHVVTADVGEYPAALRAVRDDLRGRSMLVRKLEIVQVECIARGYLVGSGWAEYKKTGTVHGMRLRTGYRQAEKLDKALFTPSIKAEQGMHDENISVDQLVAAVGAGPARELGDLTLTLYTGAADYAATRGVIIADTKFEFGRDAAGRLIVADEVLTPDSSRFWPADQYATGGNPPSLDKQFVRDWLDAIGFNHEPPAPALPDDIVAKTRERYVEAYRQLTGRAL
jgi:phosphoribosylaminoimidazole-succinocarboxamide synthase